LVSEVLGRTKAEGVQEKPSEKERESNRMEKFS